MTGGIEHVRKFCTLNALAQPEIQVAAKRDWSFAACAYYRPNYIAICPELCAVPGITGRQWSWPGYCVDRTPWGVLAHETGHLVDWAWSKQKRGYFGDFSIMIHEAAKEKSLTGYDDGRVEEWFAEMMRLYITNSNLLAALRPKTHALLASRFVSISPASDWQTACAAYDMPQRYYDAISNKLK